MAIIRQFEDLLAWQKARELVCKVYLVTREGAFAKDFGLRDQIRRASVSVMSNIAEGFERSGSGEFHQYLVIAKGSCAEVRSQLYTALDVDYLSHEKFDELMNLAQEVGRIIGGLRQSVDKRRKMVNDK